MHTRMTMSAWAGPFQFYTTRDDGEYDGDIIAELFPLPARDFEIIYTPSTQTLLFRFRSTGVDQFGHRDNLADQRFISRLIQLRLFEYTIDMSHYNNLPVANRIIEMPYSIITAFDERGIDFTVIAGDTSYTLSPGFAGTPQNTGFGLQSRLRIDINNLSPRPALPADRFYLTAPQSVSINAINPHNRISLSYLAAPLVASHSINRAMALDYNIGAYVRTPNDTAWRRMGGTFNETTGTITTSTTSTGHFAAIAQDLPVLFDMTPQVRDALHFVNSKVGFQGLDWFAPYVPINAWQINKLIAAVALGSQTVAISEDLTPSEMASLRAAGMLVPGADTVTREYAMSGLVRLYEVRTGRRVTGRPGPEYSSFPDIAAASPHLQSAMLRAEVLGFLNFDTGIADPQGTMTMGDAILIFEIILRN
jgi:hypothetical protein